MKRILLLLLIATSALAESSGLRRLPPLPPEKVKLESVAAAVKPVCSLAVTRSIHNGGELSESISIYFREIGHVFCGMATNANFTPEYLTNSIDKIPAPLTRDTYIVDLKTSIVVQYRMAYDDRLRAELPPVEWLLKVANLFCMGINEGLLNSGRVGLK